MAVQTTDKGTDEQSSSFKLNIMLLLHRDAEEQQCFYYNQNVSTDERSLKKTNLATEHSYSMVCAQTERE